MGWEREQEVGWFTVGGRLWGENCYKKKINVLIKPKPTAEKKKAQKTNIEFKPALLSQEAESTIIFS